MCGICRIITFSVLLVCTAVCAQPDFEYLPVDDFEDTSAWIKGDPTTDMEQREVGYAPSTKYAKQGKQSLAFMIRVDWTEKPGVQYAKGWPMISRLFDEPQDWAAYDRLELWVYPETEAMLPLPKALRCGIGTPEGKPGEWHDIVLKANEWNAVSVPLTEDRDWTQVTGVWFYVAEGWYRDGDCVNFYLDDMRLARLTSPRVLQCTASTRVHPRGKGADVYLAVEGPTEGVKLRAILEQEAGPKQTHEVALEGKRATYTVPLSGFPPGSHTLQVELVGADGTVLDRTTRYLRIMQAGERSYLNLITFYTPHILDAKPGQMAVINDTPYAGVASALVGGYDTDPVAEYDAYADQIKMLKDTCEYDVWPWIFSNRIIARMPDAPSHASSHAKVPEYFDRIKCMDLDDAAGARSDMMKLWRQGVRMAKDLGSPGIVIDLEAYNNYRTYSLPYVAEHRGETVGQVARACEAIGEDLAKIIEEEYPQCILWSLFSRLRPAQLKAEDYDGPLYPVPGHIALGFLRYCKEHDVPAKYLCGGEVEVGYYNANVAALKERIRNRDTNYATPLEQFPDHFFLAGTISPYHDVSILTSWIQKRAGDDPELKTIQDFQPMFKTLFDAYDWVWIYASSAAKTLPYSPANAALYGEVLQAALAESEQQTGD